MSPGAWHLTWTNAGHPPPLLVTPDGMVHHLDEHGPLVHPAIGSPPRTERTCVLPAGSLLLLYTDGLVEHRGSDLDAVIGRTGRLLADSRGKPLPDVLEYLADHVPTVAPLDDIALLAVSVAPTARRS